MTLSSLIKKEGLIGQMTATSATTATQIRISTESVAKVATVAVTESNPKEKLTQFVQKCCADFPVTAQQVIDNLLSVDDELDIINGDIPADSLQLHIKLWVENNMPYYSGKVVK